MLVNRTNLVIQIQKKNFTLINSFDHRKEHHGFLEYSKNSDTATIRIIYVKTADTTRTKFETIDGAFVIPANDTIVGWYNLSLQMVSGDVRHHN